MDELMELMLERYEALMQQEQRLHQQWLEVRAMLDQTIGAREELGQWMEVVGMGGKGKREEAERIVREAAWEVGQLEEMVGEGNHEGCPYEEMVEGEGQPQGLPVQGDEDEEGAEDH